jgi:ABC-type glycerol-3-phosphate transport system permease component
LTGYGFAKFEFRFKRPLFIIVLATLMVPVQITLVPLFLLMHTFGWLDHLQAVIVPAGFGAFGVFLMRQSMLAVPTELLEAARIDGASELRLYWQIALPLTRAGLTVLGILTFLNAWNDFLWPIIVLQSDTNMTVPVGLASLNGLYHVRYGMIDAGAFLSTVPIIAAFILLRKQFLSGLTAGAFKGARPKCLRRRRGRRRTRQACQGASARTRRPAPRARRRWPARRPPRRRARPRSGRACTRRGFPR